MSARPEPRPTLRTRPAIELLPCLFALLSPFASHSAAAQSVGNGVKVGEGRLHPTLDLELRFDSAAGYLGQPPVLAPEAITHVRPGLRFELPAPRFTLTANAKLTLVYYTGLVSPGWSDPFRVDGEAEARLLYDPTGHLSADVSNRFIRSDRTQSAAIGLGIVSAFNETRAALTYKPGGGALELSPQASFTLERFDAAAGDVPALELSRLNYQDVSAGLEGRWRFFPKTAFALEAGYRQRWYRDPGQLPASIVRGNAGVVGLLTPKVSAVAKLGYARDLGPTLVGGLIAQLEGTYRITDTSHVRLGYARMLSPVPLYGTFRGDRVLAETRLVFGGKLTLRGEGSLDLLTFTTRGGRRDLLLNLVVSPEYELSAWLTLAAGYVLAVRGSEGSAEDVTGANFVRNEVYVRISLLY